MDQENKAEASEQGNEPQKLNELHKKLLWGFGLIAVVAIGAYAFRFRGWPLSENPSDWAHFATYLSGTVGVTAVVATLIVLVRTLGQQQALIDSQGAMLIEQRNQIKISKNQLINEKMSRDVEFAYQATLNIFPYLIKSIEKGFLEGDVSYYDMRSKSFVRLISPVESRTVELYSKFGVFFCTRIYTNLMNENLKQLVFYRDLKFLYIKDCDLLLEGQYVFLLDHSPRRKLSKKMFFVWLDSSYRFVFYDVFKSFLKVFETSENVSKFAAEKIKISLDLKGYMDVSLDDVFEYSFDQRKNEDKRISYRSVLLCYHAFLMGLGDKERYCDNVKYLCFPENIDSLCNVNLLKAPDGFPIILKNWYEIGKILKDIKPAEVSGLS